MRAQLTMGRDLVLRSAVFQACFLSAISVAARTSAAAFMLMRLGFVLARTCGTGWAVTGAVRHPGRIAP
jgi:hypothetical protein